MDIKAGNEVCIDGEWAEVKAVMANGTLIVKVDGLDEEIEQKYVDDVR